MTVQRDEDTERDYAGLAACWKEFSPRLLQWARARGMRDPDDVVQDVYFQLVQRWGERDQTRSMGSLLWKILNNELVNEFRRGQRQPENPTGDAKLLEDALEPAARPTDMPDPERAVINADRDRIVRDAVAALSPAERSVLYQTTGISLPDLPGQPGTPSEWQMRRKGPAVVRHMRCELKDLRGLFPAIGCGALLSRWWAKLQGATAATVGCAAVTAALVLGGTSPWLDDPDPAPGPSQQAEAPPQPISIAPSRSSHPHDDQAPTKDATTQRHTTATDPQPRAGDDPEPAPPLRHSLDVDPDTGPGEKERDDTQVDTALGTLIVGGDAHATGPIGEPPCLAGACSPAGQTGINGP